MNKTQKIKKFLVLGILFLLPITAYMFFSSGVNNFAKLPILTQSVSELNQFKSFDGEQVFLKDHITVLCFFGEDVASSYANAFNLSHKIYKKNFQFKDFQFVIVMPLGTEEDVKLLLLKLSEIEDPQNWKFVFGPSEKIFDVFYSLQTNYVLDSKLYSPYAFIVDKERNLRGRDDDKDEDEGILFGFDARDYSEINNKMGDDIKVILAEYRLALKKYNSNRDI